MTRGVRVWIRIRYVSKPVLIRIRLKFPFLIFLRKYRERPLKRVPNTALRLTHVRERKLAAPPFDYSEKMTLSRGNDIRVSPGMAVR